MLDTCEFRTCKNCKEVFSASNQTIATTGIPVEESLPTNPEFISELPDYRLCPMDLIAYYMDLLAFKQLPRG